MLVLGLTVFHPTMGEVSIAAETIFTPFGFPITNSMLMSWLVMAFLIIGSFLITRNMKEVPSGLQSLVEWGMEFIVNLVESIAGKTLGRKILPLIATIFIFVLFSNWFGLLPFFGNIGVYHHAPVKETTMVQQEAADHESATLVQESTTSAQHPTEGEQVLVPLFRSPSTDLNFTVALALISVVSFQIFGVRQLGVRRYVGKFLNFHGPIEAFVGILEIVSEFAKIISLAFRLFGNIFAGEVLLIVIGFLVPWLGTIPFLGLEVFIGGIQAFIFAILTLVFISMATTAHDEH
jgi:F-type H+-transporting ATPase subunit a